MDIDEQELNALISLLDDPDDKVFSQVRDKIISLGDPVIPELEHAWENSFDNMLQSRLENIIHKIQFEKVTKSLREWAQSEEKDLLEGAILISKFQYPDLDEEKVEQQIKQITQDVWLEINMNLTALEKVKIINRILFKTHKFKGNRTNYHAPQNSYINTVLETKRGNPLSLSLIYLTICKRLKMPVFGVNLPEHFVLVYVTATSAYKKEFEMDDILFYINPFSNGFIFSQGEIDNFLKQLKIPSHEHFYLPCGNLDIIQRLIRNLIFSYEKLGYPDKKQELEKLLKAITL